MIHDWNDVAQTLARAGACSENVVLAIPRGADCLFLVPVQVHLLALRAWAGALLLAAPEDVAALRMEDPLLHQLIDSGTALKRRIQLDFRVRPEKPLVQPVINERLDALVSDTHEALGILREVVDELTAQFEDVHATPRETTSGTVSVGANSYLSAGH